MSYYKVALGEKKKQVFFAKNRSLEHMKKQIRGSFQELVERDFRLVYLDNNDEIEIENSYDMDNFDFTQKDNGCILIRLIDKQEKGKPPNSSFPILVDQTFREQEIGSLSLKVTGLSKKIEKQKRTRISKPRSSKQAETIAKHVNDAMMGAIPHIIKELKEFFLEHRCPNPNILFLSGKFVKKCLQSSDKNRFKSTIEVMNDGTLEWDEKCQIRAENTSFFSLPMTKAKEKAKIDLSFVKPNQKKPFSVRCEFVHVGITTIAPFGDPFELSFSIEDRNPAFIEIECEPDQSEILELRKAKARKLAQVVNLDYDTIMACLEVQPEVTEEELSNLAP